MDNKTKVKKSASERYKKEYAFGMKHKAVLQLINTVGRKLVYQDLLTKILLENNYCTNVTRLIQQLENNKLVATQKKEGFKQIQLLKLGILVAEGKEDMDSVAGVGKCYDQDNRDERIEFRLNYFYYKYIQKEKMSLEDAMEDVFGGTNTLFDSVIPFYENLKNFNCSIAQIDKQIEHINLIKSEKQAEMKTLKKENKPTKVEKVTRIDTLERFARREMFIDSITVTKQKEVIANVVIYNRVSEMRTKRINIMKDMINLLNSLGIYHYTITLINQTDILASRFYKNNKVDLPFQFCYFDNDFNMQFINTCETSEVIANRLETEIANRIERDRKKKQEQQRKMEERQRILAQKEAKRQSSRYYNYDFKEVFNDFRLIELIERYIEVLGSEFDKQVDAMIRSKDILNDFEEDIWKLSTSYYDDILRSRGSGSVTAFKSYRYSNYKNFVYSHQVHKKLKAELLDNPKIKKFNQFIFEFDEKNNSLSWTKSDEIYKKHKKGLF